MTVLKDYTKVKNVNGVQQIFLQYDNECKQGNRVLIFLSERASQIQALSTVLCLDGTFNFSPYIINKYFQ